jgi:hypothetical protein
MMEKYKRGLTQQIEFSVPITLEEAKERLHDLANQRFSRRGKLKVDETALDTNTSEFRVWVWPNAPDVEVNGFLTRRAETETFITGKARIGCFSYYLPIALLVLAVFVLVTSSLQSSAIFLLGLVILIGIYWYYIRKSRNQLVSVVENKLRGKRHTDTKFISIKRKNV